MNKIIPFKQPYRWYAVYIKYKMEKKVYEELKKKDIEVYLPLKREKRQWSDRIKVIEEPLLWGYLFVRVSNKEYYDVLVTAGALRYVCFEGKATPIPDRQIEDLKLFMQFANESVVVTSESVSKGDLVKVCYGPFMDVHGEVVEIRGKQRLVLYILIEKCTTFSLKSIPLIKLNWLFCTDKINRKNDDKYGYQTRDFTTLFSGE